MTSKLKYHKNHTELGANYQLVLPLSLEGVVPDDDSVRLLSHELEELDYTLLYQDPHLCLFTKHLFFQKDGNYMLHAEGISTSCGCGRYLSGQERCLDAGSILKNNGRKTRLSVSECNCRFWL